MITEDMKVSEVLKLYPETLEVFLEVSPAFQKLKNPLLRKVLAPRVTIAQAAKIADLATTSLVTALNMACGLVSGPTISQPASASSDLSTAPSERPPILENLASEMVFVDVRDDINQNKDPFKKIMTAVKQLHEGQVMHLVNVFEPVPLYDVLAHRGLAHWSEQVDGDWHIYFYPVGHVGVVEEMEPTSPPLTDPHGAADNIIELDVSGLEPPEPMMKILSVLPTLPEGATLRVHHHREPKMLYPHLSERGFEWTTTQLADGSYRIIIHMKGDD
jgi:uncharacterized protein (DUF2249 family)